LAEVLYSGRWVALVSVEYRYYTIVWVGYWYSICKK